MTEVAARGLCLPSLPVCKDSVGELWTYLRYGLCMKRMQLLLRSFLLSDPVRFDRAFDERCTSVRVQRASGRLLLGRSAGRRLPALVSDLAS